MEHHGDSWYVLRQSPGHSVRRYLTGDKESSFWERNTAKIPSFLVLRDLPRPLISGVVYSRN